MISIKPGVSMLGIKPETLLGLVIANSVFGKYNCDTVLTSGSEGIHGYGSLHFSGNAFDIRSKNIPDVEKEEVLIDLRECLSDSFDVILENEGEPNEHFHIEYQPKTAP